MAKSKSFKVTRGNSFLTVYPYKHPKTGKPGWRFAWREKEGSPWRYVTRPTKATAETAAWEKLGEIASDGFVWSGLARDTQRFLENVHQLTESADHDAVIEFLKSRKRSAEIVASVTRFMDFKVEEAQEQTRHLSNVRRDIESMASHFAGRSVIDITPLDLKKWWTDRVEGRKPKTRNEVRANLVAFWNWAVMDGLHPKDSTPADKLPRVEVGHGERRVVTLDEMKSLLEAVSPEWRSWAVLGAFCGLRPEEIAPPQKKGMSKASKRGIHCEEIDFRFKVIHLPAVVSKVNTPRKVPLCDAALAWLKWAGIEEGMTGPVCLHNPSEKGETARLGKLVFKGAWPQDILRHSYGSFRNALLRNLPQVAEEMGTSEAMLRRHYHNPRTKEEGEAYFELRPNVIRCDPMKRPSDSFSEKTRVV